MTVKEFINILKKAKDIDIAPIEFWYEGKQLELESLGQFGIVADVTVHLKDVKDAADFGPAIIRRDKRKMANETLKKIKKDIKKRNKSK